MKVSIITTTFNDYNNLKKIVSAVQKQDYNDIEHIIIDGGSTDGTLDLIKAYKNEFPEKVRYISEKDHGIYDAINKGIRMAQGEIIGCCFDQYATKDVLSKMVSIIEKEKTDGVHGNLCYVKDGKVVRYWKQGQGKIQEGWMPAHPTLYLKKSVYEQ